jgi:hypothetical protein
MFYIFFKKLKTHCFKNYIFITKINLLFRYKKNFIYRISITKVGFEPTPNGL